MTPLCACRTRPSYHLRRASRQDHRGWTLHTAAEAVAGEVRLLTDSAAHDTYCHSHDCTPCLCVHQCAAQRWHRSNNSLPQLHCEQGRNEQTIHEQIRIVGKHTI